MSGPWMVPDGSPSSSAANAAAEQLIVLGSRIEADPDELAAIAGVLDSCGDDLEGASARARAASASLAVTSPYDAASGGAALARCAEASSAAAAAAALARELARDVRHVARDYEWTEEAAATRLVRTAPRQGSLLLPGFGWARLPRLVGESLAAAFARGQLTPSDAQFGHLVEEWAWTVTGGDLYPSWAPHADDPVQRVAGPAALLVSLLAGVTTTVRVRRIDPPGVVPDGDPRRPTGPALGRVEDLVAGVHALYPGHGGAAGSIRVDRVVTDGEVSWQVLVPGTQTDAWAATEHLISPGAAASEVASAVRNRNPFDWGTNLQAFAGRDTAVEAGVLVALARAGARPGEPVLLVGHSQGAMTAMRLAEDPRVRERFSITSVVTVGGPVGHIPTPDGVAVLGIEHVDDLTPGLDARPNPIEYGRTTVMRDLAASDDPVDRALHVGDAHDTPAYVRTARMIDASRDPAVLAWFAASRGALPDTGATATSQYFRLERTW